MNSQTQTNAWFAFRRPNGRARVRLFCLPFGGGSASMYGKWGNYLPPQIEVCPVQFPGRENRINEAPFTRMEPLIDALSDALCPFLDLPFAIFGHSLGAIIGYELARRFQAGCDKMPVHLIVSAHQSPQSLPREKPTYLLSDRQFIDKLRQLGGTPEKIFEHSELLNLLLPMLRADFEINDTYVAMCDRVLECPITVFGAFDDKEVRRDELRDWSKATHGPFRIRMFDGEHFYVLNRTVAVLAAVREILNEHLRGETEP